MKPQATPTRFPLTRQRLRKFRADVRHSIEQAIAAHRRRRAWARIERLTRQARVHCERVDRRIEIMNDSGCTYGMAQQIDRRERSSISFFLWGRQS